MIVVKGSQDIKADSSYRLKHGQMGSGDFMLLARGKVGWTDTVTLEVTENQVLLCCADWFLMILVCSLDFQDAFSLFLRGIF